MEKKLSVILLIAMLIITMVGCQSKVENVSGGKDIQKEGQPKKELTSVEKIKEAGKIVVGTESTFPPFESIDPNDGKTIIGFDIDIAKAMADKLGVKLEIKDMKFDSLVTAVKTEMIDLTASGMTPTPDRAKEVDFSEVYYNTKQVLVVKDDNDSIKSAENMKDKKIGTQLGTTSEEAAKDIEGIVIKTLDKVDQLMLEVKSGRLDGVVIENVVAGNHIKSGGLKILDIPELNKDGEAGIAIAVMKGDGELLKVVNEVLDELKASGEYDKLLDKWGMSK